MGSQPKSPSYCPNSRSNFSLVVNQPSQHARRSDPVFEEVVPDGFGMLAGNHGNDSRIREHEQINAAESPNPLSVRKSCRQVGVQDVVDSRTHRIAAVVLLECPAHGVFDGRCDHDLGIHSL